jgi:hypothetical protein
MINKINFILTFYEPTKKINYKLEEIIDKFEKLNYSDEIKNRLIEYTVIPFLSKLNNHSKKISIIPIYLLGEPGTGKTKFIRDLSDIFGIPIINTIPVHVSDYNIYEHRRHDNFNRSSVNSHIKTLYDNIKNYSTKTFILFLDEFDKKIKDIGPSILEMMNTDTTFIKDTYLGVEIEMGSFCFIGAGNISISHALRIKSRPDEIINVGNIDPYENRFFTIIMPNITQEIKKIIAYKYIESYIDYIVVKDIDEIILKDDFPGVRQMLMNIDIYISKQLVKKMFNGTKWGRFFKND